MTLWRPLKAGDLIDIVAPGWVCKEGSIEPALRFFQSWGLKVRVPQDLLEPWTFYSNTIAKRSSQLSQALQAKDSRAVWCLRGGSGSQALLPLIYKKKAPAQKKMLIGFSDMTAVLSSLYKVWKWPSIHGPMFERLGEQNLPGPVVETVRALVFGELSELSHAGLQPLNAQAEKAKKIEGLVLGGNLITFQNLIGTKYFPNTKGSILFFEDVGERGYRIDRTWMQFDQSGVFNGVKAIVLGQFSGGEEPGTGVSRVEEAFLNLSQMTKVPVFKNLQVGHGLPQYPVVCGAPGVLKSGSLTQKLKWGLR